MNEIWRGRLIRYTPLILWTGVVLMMSSSAASMGRTSLVIQPLLEFLFPDASEPTIRYYHGLIRKAAHLFEYAVLASLAFRAFKRSSIRVLSRVPAASAMAAALFVAALDEFSQSFDPARTGTVTDVFLDLTGAAVAVTAILLLRRPGKN